jgi:hypothetical protein
MKKGKNMVAVNLICGTIAVISLILIFFTPIVVFTKGRSLDPNYERIANAGDKVLMYSTIIFFANGFFRIFILLIVGE